MLYFMFFMFIKYLKRYTNSTVCTIPSNHKFKLRNVCVYVMVVFLQWESCRVIKIAFPQKMKIINLKTVQR